MDTRLTRRKVIAVASVSLAGCTQASAKQRWKEGDDYPNDENRNRKCEIRSSDLESGKVEPAPSSLGYLPYSHTLSGRGKMHGTNQHYKLTISADSDIRIIGTTLTNAVNTLTDTDTSELNMPPDSEIVEDYRLKKDKTYEETWRVPDGETYTVIVGPDGEMSGHITVEMDVECSYYLPLEAYKETLDK